MKNNNKDLFLEEKLANKFCEQYNIKEKDRITIINAFCVGFKFEREYVEGNVIKLKN